MRRPFVSLPRSQQDLSDTPQMCGTASSSHANANLKQGLAILEQQQPNTPSAGVCCVLKRRPNRMQNRWHSPHQLGLFAHAERKATQQLQQNCYAGPLCSTLPAKGLKMGLQCRALGAQLVEQQVGRSFIQHAGGRHQGDLSVIKAQPSGVRLAHICSVVP